MVLAKYCYIGCIVILDNICCVPIFRGFSVSRGNFETPPQIDTWTNENAVNGDKDVSIGGMHFTAVRNLNRIV